MIEWLYDLQHFGVKLGLDNIRGLLRLLGHPERAYPTVLVAGTNGKGSVIAMLAALLESAGVTTGMFTSPHLVRPHERIRLGGVDIDDETFQGLLAEMRRTIEQGLETGELEAHPSFFEVITATALEAFRRRQVGAAVLEIGLGGRLDATNAVDADVSVIVSVDYDHTKSLGPTLEKIATEKAGIVKANKPLISGVLQREALGVVERVCSERHATLIDARERIRLVSESTGSVKLAGSERLYEDIRLSLAGRHQIDNARVALAAFETIAPIVGVVPDPERVRHAFASTRWPGRLQWICDPTTPPDLLFDGAHNPAGAAMLADYLGGLDREPPVVLFGAMHGKLLDAMLGSLGPVIQSMILTRPGVKRAADPEEVAVVARRHIEHVEVVPDPGAALARARVLAGSRRYVLVTGSLYLIGEILGQLEGLATPGPVSM